MTVDIADMSIGERVDDPLEKLEELRVLASENPRVSVLPGRKFFLPLLSQSLQVSLVRHLSYSVRLSGALRDSGFENVTRAAVSLALPGKLPVLLVESGARAPFDIGKHLVLDEPDGTEIRVGGNMSGGHGAVGNAAVVDMQFGHPRTLSGVTR